jgi:[ribosomal protein S5]-alanine N-acetyltransferase
VPELIGTLIRLRELNEDDIPGWFSRATDAESADLAGDPIPASIDLGTRGCSGIATAFASGPRSAGRS